MYFKKIEVTGTQASPQTVTTNTAPLDVDASGDAFPVIDLDTQVANIVITPHQDCAVNLIGDVVQSGDNISFQIAHSDVGNASDDGKFYATIDISIYGISEAPGTHYCSQTDIENRISRLTLAQLTNDTANPTSPDSEVVDAILTNVNATIDSYAGQVYTVPFSPVPALIRRIAIDIACYEVMQRRPVNMDIPKGWEAQYRNAMAQLEKISNLLLRLPDSATIASAESNMVVRGEDAIDFTDTDQLMSNF